MCRFPISPGWRRCPASAASASASISILLTLVLVALCVAALRRIDQLAVRPGADDDPREPGARRLYRRQRARLRARRLYRRRRFRRACPGALFGIFNRGVFADYVFWSKSADVMIMTILGGMHHFWGPAVGAAGADAAQPADHLLHRILAVRARHDPGRAAVRVSRRHRRRARRGAVPALSEARAMLEIAGLRKSFAGFVAVADVSLTVETGQIAAVIGPNGAGKSTLFNLITGHLRPDSGRVLLDGRDITGVQPHQICRMGIGPLVSAHQHLPAADRVRERAGGLPGASRPRRAISGRAPKRFYRDEVEALLASIGLRDQARRARRHAELRQPEAARARPRAGQRPAAAAARRADRRHVGERDARDDPAARAHRRRARR